MSDARHYRAVDAALLRATTAPPGPRPTAALGRIDADGDALTAWITAAWGEVELAAAVEEASPDLARQAQSVIDGAGCEVRRLRRTALALARYHARWRGRATPFGLFAGVAPVRLADRTMLVWTGRHHHRRCVDGRWLSDMIGRLEADRALRPRLTVTRNELAMPSGDRLVVPVPVGRGERARSVSLRRTALVTRLLHAAERPIEVGRLARAMAGDDVDIHPVVDVVGELLRCGALISCLTPPATATDGAAHVVERLKSLPGGVPGWADPLVAGITAARSGLPLAKGHLSATTGGTAPVWRTDVRLGCAVTLPVAVADEAARAVEALLRFSPAPTGHLGWRRFHARFLDRFGVGAVVALTDALDPVIGIDLPEHLTHDEERGTRQREEPISPRDRFLLRLAQQAVLDRTRHVVLDPVVLDHPAADETVQATGAELPPHVDVCFDVRAATPADLDGGRFIIGVSSVGRSAIATTGRFLGVLDALDRERMIAEFARLPVVVSGAVLAQVSFPALRLAARTAAATPPILGQVIHIGEHPHHTDAVRVRDLAVVADHRRLYLVSRRDHRLIETAAVNALARHATPVLARVLLELPHATTARITAWNWGAAECLPFRPRVQHGRAVLSPATWTLPPHPALERDAGPVGRAEVARLRECHGWPRFVHAGQGDRQLRLDLDDATDVDLFREHLRRTTGPVTVTEAPAPADHGWIDGRAHEIVVPLASTTPPAPAPPVLTRRPWVVVTADHGDLPGAPTTDPVVSARLTCRPEAIDTIVVEHLPALLDRFATQPRWWFLRHRTPAPFLRLRLHVPRYGEATELLGEWAAHLRRRGLSGDLALDTYRPEPARYGGTPAARTAVERLFAADSTAARAQLALTARHRRLDPVALTTASMIDLASAAHTDRAAGLAWLVARADLAAGTGPTDRAQLAQVLDLLDPTTVHRDVADAWRYRSAAVRSFAATVGGDGAAGYRDEPPADTVLVSWLHLHHVRALGVDPDGERRCHRLARAAALSLLTRLARAAARDHTGSEPA